MAQKSVWRGTRDLVPGKVHLEETSTKQTIKTDFQGPYSVCIAKRPKIGQAMTGFDSELKVTSNNVVELDGDAGRIDVILEATIEDESASTEPLGDPVYENEYVEVQKPIEMHPRCGKLYENRAKYKDGEVTDNGKQRTWEDWADLTDEAPSGFDHGDYVEDSAEGPTWTLAQYKSMKERGQDSYVAYQPVIRRTTIHLRRPMDLGNGSGKLQDPPGAANFSRINEYEWLGGPDRCTKSSRTYTRVTEWQGAEIWEALTYDD